MSWHLSSLGLCAALLTACGPADDSAAFDQVESQQLLNEQPSSPANSAVRQAGESFLAAWSRHQALLPQGTSAMIIRTTPPDMAGPLASLNVAAIPAWADEATLNAGFHWARDPRFMASDTEPLKRRETWLYPDDGCFARAAMVGRRLEKKLYPRPAKLFIFGNLRVTSPNAFSPLTGSPAVVSWWYHVVEVVRVADRVLVIDPAIEPTRPLEVREWVLRMVPTTADATLAVCNPYTYDPFDSCLLADVTNEASALADEQTRFFGPEYFRQGQLQRDPLKVLGDQPPWDRLLP